MDAVTTVDAPSDPSPSGAGTGACAGLFCEDFEQGQLDPAKWDTQMGGTGVAMVDQQTVAHGKYALHVHASGAVGNFATILTKNVPMALQGAGPFFGRVYLYTAMSIGGTHIQLGIAGTTRDPNVAPKITTSTTVTTTSPTKAINFNYMEFAYFASSWQLGFDLFNPAPSVAKGFVEEASYPPARDKYPVATWSCIEWQFGDDPVAMVLWVDGKPMAQLSVGHIDFSTAAKMPGQRVERTEQRHHRRVFLLRIRDPQLGPLGRGRLLLRRSRPRHPPRRLLVRQRAVGRLGAAHVNYVATYILESAAIREAANKRVEKVIWIKRLRSRERGRLASRAAGARVMLSRELPREEIDLSWRVKRALDFGRPLARRIF